MRNSLSVSNSIVFVPNLGKNIARASADSVLPVRLTGHSNAIGNHSNRRRIPSTLTSRLYTSKKAPYFLYKTDSNTKRL